MATSIASYSVGFGMDASSYIDSAQLSRKETAALIRDIESFRTPAEQLERHQNRLTDAFNKGAIDLGTYNRLMEQHRNRLGDAADGMQLSNTLLNASGVALGLVGAALTATTAAGVSFVGFLRDQQNAIDDNIDAAHRLGVGYNDLKSLQFAFQEGAGLDNSTVQDSIKKMLINTAKAVEGDESINAAFGKLGLNAGEMLKMSATEQIMAISDGMQGISSHAERLKVSMELFGKSGADLASSLGDGRAALAESIEFQNRWNSLTIEQQTAVAQNNDAWDRIGVVIGGASSKLAAEFAPAMSLVADHILGAADGVDQIDASMRFIVDTTVAWVGNLQDATQVLTLGSDIMRNMATLNVKGAFGAVTEAATFDRAEAALNELMKKREEIEEAAKTKQLDREKAHQALLAKEITSTTKDTTKEYEKAWEEIYREDERNRQEKDRWQTQMASKALKQAEDLLNADAKRQEKLNADIAKGPGAGIDANSAEAARFMAQQVNQAIADAIMPANEKPTEEEILEKAKEQVELLAKQEAKQDEQINVLKNILEQQKENGFKRIR